MGGVQSAAMQRSGTMSGEPVDFIYHRLAETGEKMLSWGTKDDRQNNKWTNLKHSDMVAVLPVSADLPHEYAVWTVKHNASDKPGEEPANSSPVFESTIASKMPTQFIQDYSPSGQSCFQIRNTRSAESVNLHVIVSIRSGTGLAASFYDSGVKPLWTQMGLHEGKDYVVHHTKSETTVTELSEEIFLPRANQGINQAIILLSGDGGVVDIVNALSLGRKTERYTRPSIALLPFGTGNALAHSLNITSDETMGLATLVRGHHQPMPLFRVTFSEGARLLVDEARGEKELPAVGGHPAMFGAVVCSWGMHAGLVADSDTTEFRKFGAERFQMAGKAALFPEDGSPPHEYEGKVEVKREGKGGWETVEREKHAYVLATMVSNLEKSFTISPASKHLDGKLRIVHFGPLPGKDIMDIMGAAYQGGKHVEDERVGYEEIEALKISFKGSAHDGRWRRICVDGKIIRVEENGWILIQKELDPVADVVCMPQQGREPMGSLHGPV